MADGISMNVHEYVQSVAEVEPVELSWGTLVWLVGQSRMPGAEQTLGKVTIHPGKRNPLHMHPNCEELLFVLEGEADHKLGEEMFQIKAGDVIRIPRGVPHWAEATGDGPVVAIISFSDGDRRTVDLEDSGEVA